MGRILVGLPPFAMAAAVSPVPVMAVMCVPPDSGPPVGKTLGGPLP
ncbi:hypothetical protein [Nonomuraea insulae]|uniref:Uncharacterized protein n=1 Tax=Nonomuraea insulae TaxID=1616787 RepID=A0ABW1DBW1_9ACTN